MTIKKSMKGNQQVVVITGASAGVGRATAISFARRGARVGLLARGKDGLEGARREVEEAGGTGLPIQVDVADAEQVEAAAARIEDKFGGIDVWINNAMVSVFSPVKETKPEEIRRVTDVTYHGSVYGTLAALKRMLPRDRGVIVQVGSALAYRAIPLQAAYCAAKHAMRGFTDSLRCELIRDRSAVKLTMVHLPAINTPQFRWVRSRLPNKSQPVPPIYQPELAGEAIYWAAQHPRREFAICMSTLQAIWGNKLAPGALDHFLASTAYDGQQTDEPRPADTPENLWQPVPGAHSTRGDFDDVAQDHCYQALAARHKKTILIGTTGVAAALLTGLFVRRS